MHAGEEYPYGLDGQHQYVDKTIRGTVNQNDKGQRQMEKVRPWCGQPSDRGRLKTEQISLPVVTKANVDGEEDGS